MFRRALIDLLLDHPMSVQQIARQLRVPCRTLEDDLKHLFKSLKHTEYVPVVSPARCCKCGFEFAPDKLAKPSRCPQCRATWLSEPRLAIRRKQKAASDLCA